MRRPTRRGLLAGIGALAVGPVAGCTGDRGTDSDRPAGDGVTPGTNESLTDWTRSTDCEHEPDSHHDSVISVLAIRDSLGFRYSPIRFSDLPSDEREILETVTETGGYATCETSPAFDRFVDRVGTHRVSRDDDMHVYLRRDDTYYRLYVEVLDQVYAY